MSSKEQHSPIIPCINCPLQGLTGLRPLTAAQIEFMLNFKQGEILVAKGGQMLSQGVVSPHLYTLLQGVVFRFKTLMTAVARSSTTCFPGT
jgi:CRP/FNR family transcriptional regulator